MHALLSHFYRVLAHFIVVLVVELCLFVGDDWMKRTALVTDVDRDSIIGVTLASLSTSRYLHVGISHQLSSIQVLSKLLLLGLNGIVIVANNCFDN